MAFRNFLLLVHLSGLGAVLTKADTLSVHGGGIKVRGGQEGHRELTLDIPAVPGARVAARLDVDVHEGDALDLDIPLLEAALSRRPAKNHDLLNGRRIDGRDYERVVGTHKSEAGATKRASRIRKRGFHVRVVKGHTRSGRECWGIYRHGSI